MRPKDELAIELAIRNGMPYDVHIPIAARNIDAIIKYIGSVSGILVNSHSTNAFLVNLDKDQNFNKRSAIWNVEGSEVLNCKSQVWVHVNYSHYRMAYYKGFPEQDLSSLVIDHIMNRRVARLKGFEYLRIIPISRVANSSSGNMTEKYGVEYHSTQHMKQLNGQIKPFLQYADLADIVKMLNLKTGGSFQQGVNEAQKYLLEEGIS